MVVYWILFAYFAAGAMLFTARVRRSALDTLLWLLGGALIAVLIGLRYRVGADWDTYVRNFNFAQFSDLGPTLAAGDPAYQLLNWTVGRLGADIWLVNLVCALIFLWGLMRFASAQAEPWLAVLVSTPYLIIVVAMGYTRQSVALAILMAGLAAFIRGRSIVRFAGYVTMAALFHRTAVAGFLPVALSAGRSKIVNLLIALAGAIVFYDYFLADTMQKFMRDYFEARYASEGAGIRVALNALPALLFLAARSKFGFTPREKALWTSFSLGALAFVGFLLLLPSSTAVDRMALYLMPLQVAIVARIPGGLLSEGLGRVLVIIYSFAIQFGWLNYADHARYWLPYQFYPTFAVENRPR